jgi:dihydrofolate synthase/folylpolyglutamate synthase
MTNVNPEDQARIDAIEQALLARWPENRIAPTLERIAALVDILGSPQLTYPTIHVGLKALYRKTCINFSEY